MAPSHQSARGGHWFTAFMIWLSIALAALPGCSGCQQTPDSKFEVESKQQLPAKTREDQPDREDDAEGATVAETESSAPDHIEPGQSPADAGSAGTPAEGSEPNSEGSRDAESALKTAKDLRQQAGRAAAGKDFGRAFDLTTRAWEAARRFPDDERLRELTDELAAESERYGATANSESSSRTADSDTKLIEQ